MSLVFSCWYLGKDNTAERQQSKGLIIFSLCIQWVKGLRLPTKALKKMKESTSDGSSFPLPAERSNVSDLLIYLFSINSLGPSADDCFNHIKFLAQYYSFLTIKV